MGNTGISRMAAAEQEPKRAASVVNAYLKEHQLEEKIQDCLTACVNEDELPVEPTEYLARYFAAQCGLKVAGDSSAQAPQPASGAAAPQCLVIAKDSTSHPTAVPVNETNPYGYYVAIRK